VNPILKTALCHGWLDRLPDFSEPYRRSSKVSYRARFSPEEYEKLCEATRKRALEPKKKGFKWQAEQLHDYVLFAGNTGLRPDEARRLEFRDVEIVDDEGLGETILEIEVRGKRGFGYCKSMPDAVSPFERLRSRLRPKRVGTCRKRWHFYLSELDHWLRSQVISGSHPRRQPQGDYIG
jgi:hypothetical protein